MSIVRSAYTFAAVSMAVAVVMETAHGTEGAVDRVVASAYANVSSKATLAMDAVLAQLELRNQSGEAIHLVGR